MKKLTFILTVLVLAAGSKAFALETKMNFLAGSTALEQKAGEELTFGGAYILLDSSVSTDYFDIAGKVYYRLSSATKGEELKQKIELKKAFVKLRPFSNDALELAIGKLYSYYLPGAFFSISETYTGASRWGKTGVGLQGSWGAFSAGAALPLSETYAAFEKSWGIHAGLYCDISKFQGAENVKLKPGVSFWYDYTAATSTAPAKNDIAFTTSLLWSPKFKGFVSKVSVFTAFSYNAEPYVASSTFKNVSNYKSVGKAHFASLNTKANFSSVQVILEGEAGKCAESDFVPVYAAVQVLVPIVEHVSVKPRFLFYGAFDTADSSLSRVTFEGYPRLWLEFGNHTVSLGAVLAAKQVEDASFKFEWSIPFYYEFKFGK